MSSNPSAAAENPQTNPAEQNQVSFDQFLPVNITPFELSDIIIQWVQQQKLIPGQVANELKAAPFSGIFIPGYIISFTAEIDYTAERGVDRDETVFEKDGSGNLIADSKKVTDWSPIKGHIQRLKKHHCLFGSKVLKTRFFLSVSRDFCISTRIDLYHLPPNSSS